MLKFGQQYVTRRSSSSVSASRRILRMRATLQIDPRQRLRKLDAFRRSKTSRHADQHAISIKASCERAWQRECPTASVRRVGADSFMNSLSKCVLL